MYGIKIYVNTGDVLLNELIVLNNFRSLQNKLNNFFIKDLYCEFNSLLIPQLRNHQLLRLVQKFVYHGH